MNLHLVLMWDHLSTRYNLNILINISSHYMTAGEKNCVSLYHNTKIPKTPLSFKALNIVLSGHLDGVWSLLDIRHKK